MRKSLLDKVMLTGMLLVVQLALTGVFMLGFMCALPQRSIEARLINPDDDVCEIPHPPVWGPPPRAITPTPPPLQGCRTCGFEECNSSEGDHDYLNCELKTVLPQNVVNNITEVSWDEPFGGYKIIGNNCTEGKEYCDVLQEIEGPEHQECVGTGFVFGWGMEAGASYIGVLTGHFDVQWEWTEETCITLPKQKVSVLPCQQAGGIYKRPVRRAYLEYCNVLIITYTGCPGEVAEHKCEYKENGMIYGDYREPDPVKLRESIMWEVRGPKPYRCDHCCKDCGEDEE